MELRAKNKDAHPGYADLSAVNPSKTPKKAKGKARQKIKKTVDPEVIAQKIKTIARVQKNAAEAYADNTTPGGHTSEATTTKKGRSIVTTTTKNINQKGERETMDASRATDASEVEATDELETDVEGTVRKKGTRRHISYRDAVLTAQKDLDLEPINENDELLAFRDEQHPVNRAERQAQDQGASNTHENSQRRKGNGAGDKHRILKGNKGALMAVKDQMLGNRPGVLRKRIVLSPDGDKSGEDTDGGRMSDTSMDGSKNTTSKVKAKSRKILVESQVDVEMSDVDPELTRNRQTSKRQREVVEELGLESEGSVISQSPPPKKSRATNPKHPQVEQSRRPATLNKRSNVLIVSSDPETGEEGEPLERLKRRKALPVKERRERNEVTAEGTKHKGAPKKDKVTHPEPAKRAATYMMAPNRSVGWTPQVSKYSHSKVTARSSSGTSQPSEVQHPKPTIKRRSETQKVNDNSNPPAKRKRSSSTSTDASSADDNTAENGVLSDCDERDGAERRYAENSPLKGKQRLNSQALVKVEHNQEYEKKARSRVTKQDLPAVLTLNDAWTKQILPTLFRWFAAQGNPWHPVPSDLEYALESICRHFVGEEYELIPGMASPEVQLCLQRLSDAWRNPIKNAAFMIVINFFESHSKYFKNEDALCQQWALEALDKNRFIYGFVKTVKVRGKKELILEDLFQSELILHTFATHFNAVKNSSWVQDLSFDKDELPRAALAISAAAVEWSLTLWTSGLITFDKIREAKKNTSRHSRVPKINFTPKKNSRGSETAYHTAFSAAAWNVKTLQYLRSVNSLDADEMKVVMDRSRELIKISTSHAKLEETDDDPRGNLRTQTFNDSEIESVCSDNDGKPGWGSVSGYV